MFQCSLFPFAGIESFSLTAGRRRRADAHRGEVKARRATSVMMMTTMRASSFVPSLLPSWTTHLGCRLALWRRRSRCSHRRKVLLGWILPISSPPRYVSPLNLGRGEEGGGFAGGRETRFNGPGGFTKVDCVSMYVLSMYVGVHRRPSRQPSR